MTNEELWQAALGEIEISISKANFITWFKNTAILSNNSGRVVIGVPNGFAKEWLENKYNSYILRALQNFHNEVREITCIIDHAQAAPLSKNMDIGAVKSPNPSFPKEPSAPYALPAFKNSASHPEESNLNNRYLFENFIVGENNELARAACYAVSQNLGKLYNPLFIYGGVGLGKTHLLQSIGNEILIKDPKKRVKYITSERFTTELINSIKSQTIDKFKDIYRKIDLLIIDDIQFLAGKEKTQNEFFHIFNALYQINKQIVLSSDRPPKSIPTLEERLRSRFEGGMIADISQPDLETRMAILKAKTAEKNFYIEEEVIRFIAENIKNNIRELEGALNRVMALCDFNQKPPTINNVKQALSGIISSGKKQDVQYQHIIKVVSDFYKITYEELINKGRKKEIVRPRQIIMYLLRSELNSSYPGIGAWLGGRDHTTVLHAYEKIQKELEINEKLKEEIKFLTEAIYQLG